MAGFGLPNFGQLTEAFKKAQQIQQDAAKLQEELDAMELEGQSSCGRASVWLSGNQQPLRVRLSPEARTKTQDLESLPLTIMGPQGPQSLPLGQVARIVSGIGPARIDHLDRDRVITVQANTQGKALSEVTSEINARIQREVTFPPGYSMKQGGQTKDQKELFTRVIIALGVAVMLMYFVLVVQFGSFLDPLAILLSLPLSLIGVMLALLVTGSTLNLMSLIGVILLMGIVAKNAILLIDFAKWSEESGLSRREAIVQAGRRRLRPIMMTALAAIAGMLPLALAIGAGSEMLQPLAVAVIGGILISMVLSLVVTPALQYFLER